MTPAPSLHRSAAPPPDGQEHAAITGLAELAHRHAGLWIRPGKQAMLEARLARRLRALGMARYADYLAHVSAPAHAAELQQMIMALTTNVSHFFREAHHFTLLRDRILPPLVAAARAGQRIRLWSAGCARGQEAYSMALVLLKLFPDAAAHDIRILGTDINGDVVEAASTGFFAAGTMHEIPDPLRTMYFRPVRDGYEATPGLRALVHFRQHNLLETWSARARFDVIFCRNVLIYFDPNTQSDLLMRFAKGLTPGGWLCLGHAERLAGPARETLKPAGRTAHVSGRNSAVTT